MTASPQLLPGLHQQPGHARRQQRQQPRRPVGRGHTERAGGGGHHHPPVQADHARHQPQQLLQVGLPRLTTHCDLARWPGVVFFHIGSILFLRLIFGCAHLVSITLKAHAGVGMDAEIKNFPRLLGVQYQADQKILPSYVHAQLTALYEKIYLGVPFISKF